MKKKKKPPGLWTEVVREFITNYDLDFMEESGFVFDGIFYLLYFKYHEDLGINNVLEFNEKFSQELEKIQYS